MPPAEHPPTRPSGPHAARPRFQFSLKWLLVAVTAVAVLLALGSLLGYGVWWIVYLVVFCVVPTPLLIVAIFGSDDYRAFSIGALVPWFAMWFEGMQFGLVGGAAWVLLGGGACGAVAVVTRRWIARQPRPGSK